MDKRQRPVRTPTVRPSGKFGQSSSAKPPKPLRRNNTTKSRPKQALREQPKVKPVPLVLPDVGQELELTVATRVGLRQQAHRLEPVVMIGQAGLTDAVLLEIERALRAHGLIKVKAGLSDDKAERAAWIRQITGRLSAANVQQIGKTLVLYRPR